jgi:hypothetical protein
MTERAPARVASSSYVVDLASRTDRAEARVPAAAMIGWSLRSAERSCSHIPPRCADASSAEIWPLCRCCTMG